MPRTAEAVSHLLTLFAGEPVDLDASLGSRTDRNQEQKSETQEGVASNPALLDRARLAIQARHYSHRTEKTYVGWIRRFLLFHRYRDPSAMKEVDIGYFLSSLANDRRVSASTQNQALNALLFLLRVVLGKEIGYVNGVVRAKRPKRLPVVLAKEEVRVILARLQGTEWIMTLLLYGACSV